MPSRRRRGHGGAGSVAPAYPPDRHSRAKRAEPGGLGMDQEIVEDNRRHHVGLHRRICPRENRAALWEIGDHISRRVWQLCDEVS